MACPAACRATASRLDGAKARSGDDEALAQLHVELAELQVTGARLNAMPHELAQTWRSPAAKEAVINELRVMLAMVAPMA